ETRRSATEEKMKSVLSNEQYTKWEEIKQERKERVAEKKRKGFRKGKAKGEKNRGEKKGRNRVKGQRN
ncbi:MAG: hypothetical protein R6V37_00240, partial [Psychroflexus maritimus]